MKTYIQPNTKCEVLELKLLQVLDGSGGGVTTDPSPGPSTPTTAPYRFAY